MKQIRYGTVLVWLGVFSLVPVIAGCMGSPVYRLWHRSQWLEDEKYGPTLHKRSEELAKLRSEAEEMPADQQAQVAQQLNQLLTDEPTPLYRSELVQTLGELSTPSASEALRTAIHDPDASVRIEACRAWGKRGGDEAVRALGQVVGSDTDIDVRIEATRQLGNFEGHPAAVQALGVALDDADPALQHRAVKSLEDITGEEYGNSVPAWRQYVRGETVNPPESPSLAERVQSWF